MKCSAGLRPARGEWSWYVDIPLRSPEGSDFACEAIRTLLCYVSGAGYNGKQMQRVAHHDDCEAFSAPWFCRSLRGRLSTRKVRSLQSNGCDSPAAMRPIESRRVQNTECLYLHLRASNRQVVIRNSPRNLQTEPKGTKDWMIRVYSRISTVYIFFCGFSRIIINESSISDIILRGGYDYDESQTPIP